MRIVKQETPAETSATAPPAENREASTSNASNEDNTSSSQTINAEIDAIISSLQQTSISASTKEFAFTSPEKRKPSQRPKFKGDNPNVKWRAYSKEELEFLAPDSYISMEKQVEAAKQSGIDTLPCFLVPQHSEEWFKLRQSRLTGSLFSTALGFFEKKAAKHLKLQNYFVSHGKLESMTKFAKQQYQILNNLLSVEEVEKLSAEKEALLTEPLEFTEAARIKMNWGTHHEQNAILTFLKEFPQFRLRETGLWELTEEGLPQLSTAEGSPFKVDFATLPRIGASPDGILEHKETESVTSITSISPKKLLEVKCPCPFNETYIPKSKRVAAAAAAATSETTTATTQQAESEEPFYKYSYMKRKPHDHVPVYYIPQIIAQMLTTGAKSVYYISWTPTGGSNIFEICYNDEYAARMLKLLSTYYQTFVVDAAAQSPPENMFYETPEYQQFLDMTLKMSEDAKLVQFVEESVLNGNTSPLFLE